MKVKVGKKIFKTKELLGEKVMQDDRFAGKLEDEDFEVDEKKLG